MTHFGTLLILGIGIFGGILGATLFQKMKIPQVVGYIILGLILGETGLGIISTKDVESLKSFNFFALGLIGFLVGGELKGETFRQYGKQFFGMLFGEGVLAFILVGVASGLVVYHVLGNVAYAAAAGVVFGAIASATDPASTIQVLWETRSKGELTTSLIAIVALDDALAMTLYAIGTGTASILAGGHGSPLHELAKTLGELLGALVLGGASALALNQILRIYSSREQKLTLAMGMLLLVIGVAEALDLDVILASMVMGIVLVNIAPRRSKDLFSIVQGVSLPIYIVFFVLVGARLTVHALPTWLWVVVVLYVVGRSLGKYVGMSLGAKLTGAAPEVVKYGGLGLFAQGGVAVGLSIMASHHLAHIHLHGGMSLGDAVIFGVTATTLIVQLLGPPMAKLAVYLAGEIGRNVTEEDVIESMKVSDVMKEPRDAVQMSDNLEVVLKKISESDLIICPVVDGSSRLQGILTLEDLKEVLFSQEVWNWLLAQDAMRPVPETIRPDTPLKDALAMLEQLDMHQLPVVDGDGRFVGILDRRYTKRRIGSEVLRRSSSKAQATEAGA